MLKRTLIMAVLALVQFGCVEEGRYYNPIAFTQRGIDFNERIKREMLELEDITIGNGPIAAAGRKVTAEIMVRYSDGTLVYQGPIATYWGMREAVFIDNSPMEPNLLSLDQTGIAVGLNGMAVGGKRRIIVPPNLICYRGAVGESLDRGASPGSTCLLVYVGRGKDNIRVQRQPLVVEATLIASCRPVDRSIGPFGLGQGCREVNVPERQPSDPIWRFYHILPSQL